MSLVRDIQSKLPIKVLAGMTIASGANAAVNSVAINTEEYEAISVGIQTSIALTAGDILTYKFQQSDDGSTGWTDVPINGHLPNRKNPERTLEIAQNSELQRVGCFSSDKFVRLVIAGTGETGFTLTPIVVLEAMLMESADYSTVKLPSDGLP
jgi:hypothetical protein